MEKFVVELSPYEEEIRAVIEPLLDSEGFELLVVKLNRSQTKSVLAIYVDRKDQENGVVLENLTDISRLLGDVLDATFAESSLLRGQYNLEVSSPGLDRPLSKVEHFKKSIGKKIRMRLKEKDSEGAKKYSGILRDADEEGLVFTADGQGESERRIFFKDLMDANTVYDFSQIKQPKKSKK